MKASDLYFMKSEEEQPGVWLVTKEFWNENTHIDDNSFGPEIWKVIPKWDGEGNGFCQESESYFEYRVGSKRQFSKGIELLQSLGIQEVVWGQKKPLEKYSESEIVLEELLDECLDALQDGNQLLIKKIEKYLEDNCF